MKLFTILALLLLFNQVSLAGTGRIVDSGIADNAAIKVSKLQSIGSNTVLANTTGGSAPPTAVAISSISTTPGGSNHDIQFNNSGALGGSNDLYWSGTNLEVNGALAVGAWSSVRSGVKLDIFGTDGGLGVPILTDAQRNAIAPARDGVIIWNSDNSRYESYSGGFWNAPFGNMYTYNNLSDLPSISTARSNLGLGTAATQNSTAFLQTANNLSDILVPATARTNLGLGTAATQNSSAFLQPSNNLSDVISASTSRTNLGLGTAATGNTANFSVGTGLTISSGTGTGATLQALTVGIAAGYYLPSTSDQTTWNGKQDALTFSAPLVNTTGTVSCNVASGSQAGCLSSANWTTFNNKYTLPSLTTGSVLYYGASDISQDNSNFFYDSTNHRLCLGATSCSDQLEVTKNFRLPVATATTGIIYKGSNPFIHDFAVSGTTGKNTFIGIGAGNLTLTGSTTTQGSRNTIVGYGSASALTTGYKNTILGETSGTSLTTGFENTCIGEDTCIGLNGGSADNVAIGIDSLSGGGAPSNDVCIGRLSCAGALGQQNVAIGLQALTGSNTNFSVAVGALSLRAATNGGGYNTALGFQSGYNVTSGGHNILIGDYNSATGGISTGSNNILIGQDITLMGPTLSDQLDIGNAIFGTSIGKQGTLATPKIGIGVVAPNQTLEVNGGMRLNTVIAKPTCDSTQRGTHWFTQGGTGVKDTDEVCAKDATDTYAWRTIY